VEAGHRESTESWAAILRDLKSRGLEAPKLVVGDGALGISGGLATVYPESKEQRCWNHRIINILDKLSKKQQRQAKLILSRIPYAETREQAEKLRKEFQAWCEKKSAGDAGRLLEHNWDRMVRIYDFPKQHWKHLRTTNVIESPFAAVRLRTTAAKRYKRVENATAVIWKVLLVVEKSFRRLDAPELLAEILAGVRYDNGIRVRQSAEDRVSA